MNYTSAAIDTEGGIIIITVSIFNSPNEQIKPLFLPNNDKPVKLACCNDFIIALGQSGSIYEIELKSKKQIPPQFEEIKELSGQIVVDVAGTSNFFFAVLKNGRVFGRGNNSFGKLGMPKETESVEKIVEIESLNKYKIVSAFVGSSHSIFKTSKGKMIVCGQNNYGQLFIQAPEKVYQPVEAKICKGFKFCFTGCASSVAIFSNEIPKNAANKKIEETKETTIPESPEDIKMKSKQATSKSIKELKKLREEITNKNDEISQLKELLKKSENRVKELEKENDELKNQTKKEEEKSKDLNEDDDENEFKIPKSTFKILSSEDIDNLKKVKKLGRGATSEVFEVTEEVKRVLKVLDTEILKASKNDDDDDNEEEEQSINVEQLRRFMQECEVINQLNHPNIIKTYGFFFGDSTHSPSIVLEYCETNLKKRIKKLSNVERAKIIVSLSSAMKEVHSLKIIHRDLKLENILLDSSNNAKLSDFGLCTFFNNDEETLSRTQMAGSLKYMTPEILQGRKDYDEKVDVYSFGVVVYQILTNGEFPELNFAEIVTGKQVNIPSNITKFSTQLIKDCMSFKSSDRPSFSEIYERLKQNEKELI